MIDVSSLWRVRVDLFAVDDDAARVHSTAAAVRRRVREAGLPGEFVGFDQGTGVAGRPVIGSAFWVEADDVGGAATAAVDLATNACIGLGVGPDLYDVVVIPADAVNMPDGMFDVEFPYPDMPD